MSIDVINEAKEVFLIEKEELKKVMERIDENFEVAVNIIISSKGKVVVTGIGKSGIIGSKIAATLASTGTPSIFMNSAEGLHGDLGMIAKEDIVIAISNSGNSDEVIAIMPAIKKIGAKIIAMTGNKNSKLAKEADVIIDIGVEKEACPLNLAPTSSTTAALVMGDAIAAVLIKTRDFKPENFALYHPGGSLGRRLLWKVKDVMHSGEKLPVVSENTGIEEILIELTKKKMGAVCVVVYEGADLKMKGIITEGDVRRALSNKERFFELKAEELMNKNPVYIEEDKMAIDALEVMENRESQISVLPVLNGQYLKGIVRIHDLIGKIK